MARVFGLTGLLLSAAIFGFFYAYSVSAMRGLDYVDPRVAIEAMQGINITVRNGFFFPAFFLTPVALAIAAILAQGRARMGFGAGAVVYLLGGLVLTVAVNIPMNEALAVVDIPDARDTAEVIWTEYSTRWTLWNTIRTGFSGIAVLCAGLGLWALGRDDNGVVSSASLQPSAS